MKIGSLSAAGVVYEYQTNKGWVSAEEGKNEFVKNRETFMTATHKKKVTPLELIALAAGLLAPAVWFMFRRKRKVIAVKAKPKAKRL